MISQLRILSEELSKTSSIDTAVQSMARVLSDTGKWSRFFLGVVQGKNQITHLESSGFEKDSLNLDQYGTFLLAEVDLDFGRQNQIILRPHDSNYQKTFETYCGVEDSHQW